MNYKGALDSLPVFTSELRLDDLVTAVLDITLNLTGAERAALIFCEESGAFHIKRARNRRNQDLKENDFRGSTTIMRRVAAEKQPLYVARLREDAELAGVESVQKLNLKSAICIPLWRYKSGKEEKSDLIGLLYIDSSIQVSALTEDHLPFMQALANNVVISIEHARLFEELEEKNRQIASLNEQLGQHVQMQAGSLADMRTLLEETNRELGRVYGLENLVGKSRTMQEIFRILQKVVRTEATVLISGESGTGKELVAKYIHFHGPRGEKPIVSINCSAFNDSLLESELFGHRKGAFTGAHENKSGLFHLADGGTLFLDEVGDMSPEMQKKVLRVLEDGEVRPIGSKEVQHVNVRIIAATNKDLVTLVQQDKFREDLYFRLHVLHIRIPPLRERREDIPLLIDFYTKQISKELHQHVAKIPEEVLCKFLQYDWPGNVRELINELRRFFILESDYTTEHFLQKPSAEQDEMTLSAIEKKALKKALEVTRGNKTRAAELLGLPRTSFYDKLSKYKITD